MALNELQRYRKQCGLTQKQLAEKCGLAPGTIQQYELGKRNPKIEQLQKIANVLNIPVEYLFDPINITFMSETDRERIEYYQSKGNKDIQSILLQNGYSLIQRDDYYLLQIVSGHIHGKKIRLTKKEYDALISDIDFFIKYVVDKVFDSHDYYFDD